MTTATITDLELLRTRVSDAVGRRMPEHIERLGWDAGRLAACQAERLRALLARAIAGSPFHAERLRGDGRGLAGVTRPRRSGSRPACSG